MIQLRVPNAHHDGSTRYFRLFPVDFTDRWFLRDEFEAKEYEDLPTLFHHLGGTVSWDSWDEASRQWILDMNKGKAI
jgi:hypothetical protein